MKTKKLSLLSSTALLAFLFSTLSAGPANAQNEKGETVRTYQFNELLELDPQVKEKLYDSGFRGDVENLLLEVSEKPTRQAVEGDDELTPPVIGELQLKVKELSPVAASAEQKDSRHLWVAGVVLSNVYLQGIQASYLHFNPRKNKVIYHSDLTLSGTPELSNLTLAFDAHIGKWGIYAGVNGQMIRYESYLLQNAPPVYIPGFGVESGWQHAWGKRQRFYTNLKVGSFITYYESYVYFMLEGSVGISMRLFRK